MADGSELPVGEYRIMPTEEPRKYVMAVKLSTKVINHLQKGTHKSASICFGKENKFTVDNEHYSFTVLPDEKMVQDCYYQSSDLLAEIGGIKKKLFFSQVSELTGEDRNRIKESSRQAEAAKNNHKITVLHNEGKVKKGHKPTVSKRIVTTTTPKPSRLVVPTPQARTPPQPDTPPLSMRPSQPRPLTPPPSAPQTQTPPSSSLSPPQSTPPQAPVLSPPQTQQKILSPPPSTPASSGTTPPLSSKPKIPARSRSTPTPTPTLTPTPKEPVTNAPPPKFPLRTHLIHDLAVQPRTVNKLAEKHNVPPSEITALLPSFARYKPPGLWCPLDVMFQEVDPEWHEYPPEDREVVKEKRKEALERLASAPPAPVEDKDPIKNLKNVIPNNKRQRTEPPPANSLPPPPAQPVTPPISSPPPVSTPVSTPVSSTVPPPSVASTPPPVSTPVPSESDTSPSAEPAAAKKRSRESTSSSLPTSKIAKPNPSPELLSPPLSSTSTPPSASTSSSKSRKPPHASLKPPASITSPIPTPTSSPFVPPKSKPPKTTPSPIPTPTKSAPPPTKSAPSPIPTPSSSSKPQPPKPSSTAPPSKSKQPAKIPAQTKPSSSSAPSRPSSSSSKPPPKPSSSSSKPPSSKVLEEPALKPIPPPPKFNIIITNSQDNEKYRKMYGEKYVTYRELHRKLSENRDVFLKFDKDWRMSKNTEAKVALSAKIEATYRERRAEVERTQADHSALHAELLAIKDAMRKYADSARAPANANATNPNANASATKTRTSQSKPQQRTPPPSSKPPQKKPSPPSQGLQSPPLKLQQTTQKQPPTQKVSPPKPASSSSTSGSLQQSPQKPKPQPRRQTPPPPSQKQKSVPTQS